MIIWSSRKLEGSLARGELSNWTKVKYLIIPAVWGSLSGPVFFLQPTYGQRQPQHHFGFWLLLALLGALLAYRGVKKCFHANESIDNRAFFERFAVLTVPVIVRLTVIMLPVSLLLLGMIGMMKELYPVLYQNTSFVFGTVAPVLTYVFYSLLYHSFVRFGELIREEEPEGS